MGGPFSAKRKVSTEPGQLQLDYTREPWLVCGFAVGLLLYKPTYAGPFVLLFFFTARWRALALVVASAGAWYRDQARAGGWECSRAVEFAPRLIAEEAYVTRS